MISMTLLLIEFTSEVEFKRKGGVSNNIPHKNQIMEGETLSSLVSKIDQVENKVVHNFQNSFGQVQNILDHNRLLINEINQNHESRVPDNLSRNVGLIRDLNNNIRRVVDLYGDLSSSFSKSMVSSSDGGDSSAGTLRSDVKKRIRSS